MATPNGRTEELEPGDRLAPDLGLDADGSRVLDFGPRSFKVGFDEALRPFVLDGSGGRLAGLPEPTPGDDAAKAAMAGETWKALEQGAAAIAADLVLQLERAMCEQRHWSLERWRTLFLDHPLLTHLARRLVWGLYDCGSIVGAFRVAGDKSTTGPEDEPLRLPESGLVGIAHPLELKDAAEAFGRVFARHRILQPFPQLGRRAFAPAASEKPATALARADGRRVAAGRVRGLEKRGWRRADSGAGGVSTELVKALSGGLRAVLPLAPGLFPAGVREAPEQTLGPVAVVDAGGTAVALGKLDGVTFSELVYDLETSS